jgi:hypothetical protein
MEILSNSTFILVQKMAVLLLYKHKAALQRAALIFLVKLKGLTKSGSLLIDVDFIANRY